MIQSLQITRHGGPEVLKLREDSPEKPEEKVPLKDEEVRIRVRAAGVNFADLMMRMGVYPEAPKTPFTPGYEVAGEVLEVGSSVKEFKSGDRVFGACRFGGYTSEIVLPQFILRKTPAHLSDIEAACIPVNFLTAWTALHDQGRVRKGDRVLIQSAAGGVGLAAVQMAAQVGATVVGLVGSKSKAETVLSFGASEILTYEEWEEIRTRSDAPTFDIILDSQGGESLKASLKALSPNGRVITFGISNVVAGPRRSMKHILSFFSRTMLITPFRLMMENKGVFGLNALQLMEKAEQGKTDLPSQALDQIVKRFNDKSFRVIVGKTFPLGQGAEAHRYLQSRSCIGKVVLTIQ